jgi:hypothetical protein
VAARHESPTPVVGKQALEELRELRKGLSKVLPHSLADYGLPFQLARTLPNQILYEEGIRKTITECIYASLASPQNGLFSPGELAEWLKDFQFCLEDLDRHWELSPRLRISI